MKRRIIAAAVVIAASAFFAGAASAADTIWSAQTAASGTGAEIPVVAYRVLNVMACGTGFSGTVTINQGPVTGKLTPTKVITLTTNSDCTSYYTLNPSSLIRIDFTLTGGTLAGVYLEYFK
jgi:hypothetical protein